VLLPINEATPRGSGDPKWHEFLVDPVHAFKDRQAQKTATPQPPAKKKKGEKKAAVPGVRVRLLCAPGKEPHLAGKPTWAASGADRG